MKYIVYILLILVGFSAKAQYPTQTVPTQFSTGYFKQGWHQSDSGHILSNRIPNFTPKFPGTMILYQQAGVDTSIIYWTGLRWIKIQGTDTTSLSNRINLKLNISDTSAMLSPYLRKIDTTNKWVNDIRRRPGTDSVEILKNGTWQFAYKDSTASAGSGLTSVGLSLPSAFTVLNSPLTSNGTLNVIGAGTTLEYIRGNGTLATTDTGMIPLFTQKVRSRFSATSPITYNSTTGVFGVLNANATGQKGVSTYVNSDFSTDGNGLVSLLTIGLGGSCTNCNLTIDNRGRVTAYANGTGGTGNGVDTIYRKAGQDSIFYTINGIERAIKDSLGAGGGSVTLPDTRVAFGSPSNTVTSDAAFTYINASNKLMVDSIDLIQSRQDSTFFTRLSPYLSPDTMVASGNSITVGLNATTTAQAYAYRFAASQGLAISNIAVSGTGMVSIANRHLINVNPGNTVMSTVMGGLNDVRRNGANQKTLNKIINGYKSIFANQYLKSYVGAGSGSVTRSGSWAAPWDAQAEGGKSTQGAYTSTTGDYAEYTFTDSTILLAFMGGDGSGSSFTGTDVQVSIDGTPIDTVNTNDQTDGISDGSGLSNARCAMVFMYGGLSNTSHTVRITKLSTGGGGFMICDYFGHMKDRSVAYPMLWFHAPYLTAVGYATSPSNANNTVINTLNSKIDSLLTDPFISNYSTYIVQTNNCLDTTTGMSGDGIHPNDIGHGQISDCAIAKLNAVNGGGGRTGKAYYTDKFHGVVEGQDDIFLMLRPADIRYIQNQNVLDQAANARISGTFTGVQFNSAGSKIGQSVSNADRQANGLAGGVTAVGSNPFFALSRNSSSVDEKRFDFVAGTSEVEMRFVSDDLLNAVPFFRAQRSGTTPTRILLPLLEVTGNSYFPNTGEVRMGSATDYGAFQLQNTGGFYQTGGAISLNGLTSPPSTYTVLVHGNTDSIVYKVPVSSIGGASIYTTDGTLTGDRLVGSGGYTLRFHGANNSLSVMSVINTGTSGIGLYVNGSFIGTRIESASIGASILGTSTGIIAQGATDEGAVISSSTIRGAKISTTPSSTNTIQEVVRFDRSTTGTAANGIGGAIDLVAEDASNTASLANRIIWKWTDAANATRTSQLSFTGVNSAVTSNLLTIDGDGSFTTYGRRIVPVVTSAAGTLTLGNSETYIFNGTTTTWTLPAVSGTTGLKYYIKNIGSGAITLNANAAANEIYSTSAVNTYSIAAGNAIILISNGTYFTVQ